ncbi:MAG: hypothetical protein WA960_05720 [Tunicatimonas sp.]
MERNQIYHTDPDILGSIPVFTGTRAPIDTLLVTVPERGWGGTKNGKILT